MIDINCNCIVCASEFNPNELENIVLSKINITKFKICQSCLDISDPSNDYRQARDIVFSYVKFAQAKKSFEEVKDLLRK